MDEALAHVQDATPHEDVEAWIAQVLAAAIERVRAELDAQRETRVTNDPALAVVDDIARALGSEPMPVTPTVWTERGILALLTECDRIEQHIAKNVPHLEPTAGTMSIGKIRALLRGPSS